MLKFIHVADLHLDSPLRGLDAYDGAPADEIRGAARRACERLVELALAEQVKLVVIAGDVYDGDWRDYNTGLFFVAQMAKLRAAQIPVCVVAGNHDAANRMTRWLPLPENVTYLSATEAQTVEFEDLGVAVHGQSFARAAETEDLSQRYPAARRGAFNIGLLHTCAGGREGHERYAPCTLEGLIARGYDYWALGHVHEREMLAREPVVAFSGNIQGRHIREPGAKGCLLVTVDEGRRATVEFRPLDCVRWQRVGVDLTSARSQDEIIAGASAALRRVQTEAQGRTVAARLELAVSRSLPAALMRDRRATTEALRAAAVDVGEGALWLEKVSWRTCDDQTAPAALADPQGPLGAIHELVAELRAEPGRIKDLLAEVSDLAARLPAELTAGRTSLDDPAWLRALLDEVEPMLIGDLMARDNAS